jgi:hypothetical protein
VGLRFSVPNFDFYATNRRKFMGKFIKVRVPVHLISLIRLMTTSSTVSCMRFVVFVLKFAANESSPNRLHVVELAFWIRSCVAWSMNRRNVLRPTKHEAEVVRWLVYSQMQIKRVQNRTENKHRKGGTAETNEISTLPEQ